MNTRRAASAAAILFSSIFFMTASVSAQVASVKLELYNHQVWIKVGLTGRKADSLAFLFDSGAGIGLLDSAVAVDIFKGKDFAQEATTGAGGNSVMKVLYNQSLYIGGIRVDSVNFLVNNLSRLSAAEGRKLDGIVGYDLLKKYVTRIDLDKGTLSLYNDIKDLGAEKGKPLVFEYSPEVGFLPRVKCSFTTQAGQSYSGYFFFDSGAGVPALLNTPFVNSNRLLTSSGKTLRLPSQGMTNSSDRYLARIRDFSFGGYTFKDIPLSMSQTTSGVNAMEGYAGLLGNELLFRYNLTFDYTHDAIYLQPNRYYAMPFDFPYCGFGLKLQDGGVYIAAVASDAPEKGLGLEEGAQVIGVNGRTGLGIAEIRELLKHPGKVTLKVRQQGAEKQIEIPLYPRI